MLFTVHILYVHVCIIYCGICIVVCGLLVSEPLTAMSISYSKKKKSIEQ